MPTLRPFQRLPFDRIPALPLRPHPYFEAPVREVTTASRRLGTLRIHVREAGSGPPLLLVHGLMTTSYSWRYMIEPLGRHYRLVMPDLPGCGQSEAPPDGAYDPDTLAEWIGDLQGALGIEGCAAIGNSMGGYLCLLHALSRPTAFSRLVDIHSPAFPDGRIDLLAAVLRAPGTRAFTAWLTRRSPLRWAHRNIHYHDETLKSLEEAHAYGDPLAARDGARAFVAYLAETMAPGKMRAFTRELALRKERGEAFPAPLMLLYAKEDPMVPPSNGERLLALLPEAKLTWLSETSHFMHVDSPDRVVAEVLPFLMQA